MCYPNTVAGYHVRGMTGKFMASGALPGIQAKNSTDSKQYKRLCLCGRVASGTGAMKCYPKVCFTKASVTITHSFQVFDWCIMSNPAKGKDLTLQITVNCKRAPGRTFFFWRGGVASGSSYNPSSIRIHLSVSPQPKFSSGKAFLV